MAEGWGKYDSQGEIGRGPSGRVFRAYDRGNRRPVAIKELAPALTGEPGYVERVAAEARLLATINSPNCVRVYEYFQQDGRHFIVEELVDGVSLHAATQHSGRLTPEQSLGLLKGILSGLGFAHAQGVIHRDVKPGNILLNRAGIPKVTDFDQAPFVGGPGAVGGVAHGTPAYMSPEAARGLPLDHRADIYSAGVTLYELLTGRLPFIAATAAETLRMHVEAPVPDPRDVVPDLPEEVAFVVGRAMTKDPATRPQSALEMYNELGSAAAAGYGPGWEAKSAMASVVAAAAAALAGVVPAAASAPASAAATVPTAAPVPTPVPTTAPQGPARTGPRPKTRPLRALLGLVLATALMLGGLGYGGSHGVLPAALASASGGVFKTPEDLKPVTPGVDGNQPQPRPAAANTGGGSTTAYVLDVSGSMSSPAVIPAGFPKAAELKQKQDAFESLIEEVQGGKKVPIGAIIAGVGGVVDLIHLQGELDDYLKAQGVDPTTISKLTALKVAATSMLSALEAERQDLALNDRAALVKFSDTSTVIAPLGTDMAAMRATVAGLTTEGSTDIGDGLADALKLVDGQPGAGIVLLTDGWNNTGMTNEQILSGPVANATARGVPICAIGLGQSPYDVDQNLLTQIAARTGGDYYFVADRVSLGADMLACHHAEHGQSVVDFRGRVAPGQPAAGPAFTVPAGKQRLSLTLNWPGSDLDLELRDPSGNLVGSNGIGKLTKQQGLVTASVSRPASGRWTYTVQPREVAAGGEEFFVNGATDGATPGQHFDSVVKGGSGSSGPLADVRNRTRQWITAAAIIAGLAILLLTIRGLARRMRGRRQGFPVKSKFLVPGLLYLLAVGGIVVLGGAAAINFLWTTPLIQAPKV